ncbi:YncE family protein [Burkholderia sp. MS455]|uniref:beta-propeller fold lactonase family protein n=1 Tax=Burkholderia sp. MS455 TaxID=2811788 RepID=UPI001959A733|nr:YncE family protein [Burkholderia sp. MS455]QRR07616.1 YncE family protein [Burkholderia sp. MS455]
MSLKQAAFHVRLGGFPKMRNYRFFLFIVFLLASFLLTARSYAAAPKEALYVTNRNDNTVSVIDTETSTVVATVAVGGNPFRLAVTPDGTHVYVVNANSNNVSVIDTSITNVVTTIPVGVKPAGIAITPDGTRAYVTSFTGNSVSVIDIATNTVTATISVSGKTPNGIAVTPDGKHVYVANSSSANVSVIDTASNTETATVALPGSNPIGIAVTPNGAKVYVADGSGGTVSVIDTASNTLTARIGGFSAADDVAFTQDGTKAYISDNFNNDVAVINTASNAITSTISNLVSPFGIAIATGGTIAYVANQQASNVSVINTSNNTVTTSIAVGNFPTGLAIVKRGTTPPPSHTLKLYLHGSDAPMTAGGYTMNQTPGSPSLLGIGLLSSVTWFSDPTLTGTFESGSAFQLTLPCTVGVGVLTSVSLDSTDMNGGSLRHLGTVTQVLSACLLGSYTASIPVSVPVNFTNERLKLTVSNLLGLKLNLQLGTGAYVQGTDFTGTP